MESQTPLTFIDCAKAFGPFLAAFAAVVVGVVQYYLQRQKFKLDLFDKRFRVYRKTLAFLETILEKSGDFGLSDYYEFRDETDSSGFMFGSDVRKFLDYIGHGGLYYRQLRTELQCLSPTTPNEVGPHERDGPSDGVLATLQRDIEELEGDLLEAFYGQTIDVFRPYLQLHVSESLPERLFALLDRMDSGMQKLMRSRYDR